MTSEFFDWRRNTEIWREKEHLDYKYKKYIKKIIDFEGRTGQILDFRNSAIRTKVHEIIRIII